MARRVGRVLSIVCLGILAVAASACDTLDREDDAERIRGTWDVAAVSDEEGDLSADLQQLGESTVTFETDTYAFVAAAQSSQMTLMSGAYTIEPVSRSIVLQTLVQGDQIVPIPASYRFVNEDTLELTLEGEPLAIVLSAATSQDIEFTGGVTFRLERAAG